MTAPIERLRAVLAAATPGPWEADLGLVGPPPRHGVPWMYIAECPRAANAGAIAALGTLHPALLAVVKAAVEPHWEAVGGHARARVCRLCQRVLSRRVDGSLAHADGCPVPALDAAIAAALPEGT